MTDEISGSIVTVVSVIILVGAVVAAIALRYNAKSFSRFTKAEDLKEKAEELRVFDGIYGEIARGLKEYH